MHKMYNALTTYGQRSTKNNCTSNPNKLNAANTETQRKTHT